MTGFSLKLILKFANKISLAENSQPNSKVSGYFREDSVYACPVRWSI